jgi:CRP/FNR family transcriptional regulator, cyclic AMP receptor protein
VLDRGQRDPENPLVLAKDTKIELIAGVPLFADCSRRELRELAETADEVVVPAGYTLTKEGATGREFVIIVEGAADVIRRGRKINSLGSGDFLGEIELVSRGPRTATVRTTQPTHALVITGAAFRGLLRRMPSIQIKVLQALAERLPPEFE